MAGIYGELVAGQSDPWWNNHANVAATHILIAANRQRIIG